MSSRNDLARKRSELREVIRNAAIAEFAENGLRGASTLAIADRAGISKTKLHYHIDSKEELYQEVLKYITRVWDDLFDGIPLDQGPQTFLGEYIDRKIRFSIEHPDVVRLFTNEVMRGAPLLRALWVGSGESTIRATERLNKWIEAGLIRPIDPLLLQFHIWALTEHYAIMEAEIRFMMGLGADESLNVKHISAEVTSMVLRGLAP